MIDRYAREALALSKQFHDRHAEGFVWKHVAYFERLRQQCESALEDYFRSRRIFRELGERNEEFAIDKEIGDLFSTVFFIFSDLGRTGEYYKKSLQLSRQINDQAAIAMRLHDIANLYRAQGKFLEAIPLCQEALRLNERGNALCDPDTILYSLSDSYLKAGDFDESMKYMRQALVFNEKKKQALASGRTVSQQGLSCLQQNDLPGALSDLQQALEIHKKYSVTGRMLADLHDLGLVYSRLKQDANARECFEQAQELIQRKEDQNEIMQALLAQAAMLQKKDELPKAEALLLFCENQASQKQLLEKLRETYLQLSSLYSLRHDPVNALYYQSLGKKTGGGLPSTAVWAGMQKLIVKNESDKEIGRIEMQKRRQAAIGILAICLALILIVMLGRKSKFIRKWVRDHLSSKEQRLQKSKSKLLNREQKLGELQEKRNGDQRKTPPKGNDPGQDCLQLVLRHMQKDKIFLDSEMTLKKMAAKIGANTSSLSKSLNQDLGMGFSDFINHFRIEEAKKIMLTDDQNKWDVIDICYEVGFNSLSSFYRIFKMHTGTTPAEFQRACKR